MSLEKVNKPVLFWDIRSRLHKRYEGDKVERLEYPEMEGFEDVVPQGLGTGGLFYNTSMSIYQLAMALAVAPNPAIAEIVRNDPTSGTPNLVKALRAKRVLSEFKLLDLGCGIVPGFALAAKSLGAEVHTADGEQLSADALSVVDSHTVVNLCEPDAVSMIAEATGGAFDYVTANVIGDVSGHARLQYPDADTVRQFGEQPLKHGGYHYNVGSDLLQKL